MVGYVVEYLCLSGRQALCRWSSGEQEAVENCHDSKNRISSCEIYDGGRLHMLSDCRVCISALHTKTSERYGKTQAQRDYFSRQILAAELLHSFNFTLGPADRSSQVSTISHINTSPKQLTAAGPGPWVSFPPTAYLPNKHNYLLLPYHHSSLLLTLDTSRFLTTFTTIPYLLLHSQLLLPRRTWIGAWNFELDIRYIATRVSCRYGRRGRESICLCLCVCWE